jgi:myo-inositol 2-dehydrogenase/D-chiro-inositol 1-dehydrogenase
MERYTESYVKELSDFVDAIMQDRPVPVGGHDGRVPVVMGLAAAKSYREHRPVQLDEITDHA